MANELTDADFLSLYQQRKQDAFKELQAELAYCKGKNRDQSVIMVGLCAKIDAVRAQVVDAKDAAAFLLKACLNSGYEARLHSKELAESKWPWLSASTTDAESIDPQLRHAARLVRSLCSIIDDPAITNFIEKGNPWLRVADEEL